MMTNKPATENNYAHLYRAFNHPSSHLNKSSAFGGRIQVLSIPDQTVGDGHHLWLKVSFHCYKKNKQTSKTLSVPATK